MTPNQLVDTAGSDIRQAKQGLRDMPSASDRYAGATDRLRKAQDERERLQKLCKLSVD